MKKVLATLTLTAAFAAFATTPSAAQTNPTEPTDPTVTNESTTNESATAKTITGTVMSSNSTQLVLHTSEGHKTIQLSELATPPASLSVGSQVTVTYRDVDGQLIASDLTVGSGADDTAAWATAPPAEADEDAMTGAQATARAGAYQDPATAPDLRADAEDDEFLAGRDADADARATATVDVNDPTRQAGVRDGVGQDVDTLPATAGELPLVALLGALALVSAGVLRRIH